IAASFRSIGWADEGIMGQVTPGADLTLLLVSPRDQGRSVRVALSRGPFRGRDYAILLMTVFMSSAEKARSVSVRMLPCTQMLNASAVAAISSAASLIITALR